MIICRLAKLGPGGGCGWWCRGSGGVGGGSGVEWELGGVCVVCIGCLGCVPVTMCGSAGKSGKCPH